MIPIEEKRFCDLSQLEILLFIVPAEIPVGIGKVIDLFDPEVVKEEGEKRCPKCENKMKLSKFYSRRQGDISSWCRKCTCAKSKAKRDTDAKEKAK